MSIFLNNTFINSQVVYEKLDNQVYQFIERLADKRVITIIESIRPFSRIYIAKKIKEIDNNKEFLTSLEKEELEFYKSEFGIELNSLMSNSNQTKKKSFGYDQFNRFRLYSSVNDFAVINIDPIIGFKIGNIQESNFNHRWNGAKIYGYIKDFLGYNLDFRDNIINGNKVDKDRLFTQERGINILKETDDGFEFSEVNASINYNWQWGTVTIGKEDFLIGSGKSGKVIFSRKAPSFPFIRIEVSPSDNFYFQYIHGWLHSNEIDTLTIRRTQIEDRDTFDRRDKFYVSHMIGFKPFDNMEISIGESIVYSDKIEPIYLIPVMFFRLADHFNGKEEVDTGDNAQIYGNIYFNIPKINTKLYASLFIDELSFSSIFGDEDSPSATAFTIGVNKIDPVISNSALTIEYTRVNPFVYTNGNSAQTYSAHGYDLGHWIGSNAEQFYFEYSQSVLRGLKFNLWTMLTKKGDKAAPEAQYQSPYPPFLHGDITNYNYWGAKVSYELLHDLLFNIEYTSKNLSGDKTKAFLPNSNQNEFSFSMNYGL